MKTDDDGVTCPVCGGPVLLRTYENRVYHNRIYCSLRCRRNAGHAKERAQQRASAADWDDFWAAVGDVPTQGDAAIPPPPTVAAVKS